MAKNVSATSDRIPTTDTPRPWSKPEVSFSASALFLSNASWVSKRQGLFTMFLHSPQGCVRRERALWTYRLGRKPTWGLSLHPGWESSQVGLTNSPIQKPRETARVHKIEPFTNHQSPLPCAPGEVMSPRGAAAKCMQSFCLLGCLVSTHHIICTKCSIG